MEWLDAGTAVDDLDYSVDAARAAAFYAAIRSYWPALPDDSLSPAYSGVRPKISGLANRQPTSRCAMSGGRGEPRVVHLFGIESPGLTSSLALAEHVRFAELVQP